jgi:hypothetical protein
VQTSARADAVAHARTVRRRGKVKVPKIGNWKRTPKQRGLKQGYQWKPPLAWRPASGMFYIFPAPNKRSQGATRFFYVTDGQQVLSTQHRTKSEATKALKGILSGQEAQLRVNPPNPLTREETQEFRREKQFVRGDRDRARKGMDDTREAAYDHKRDKEKFWQLDTEDRVMGNFLTRYGTPGFGRPNPPQVDVLRELGEVRSSNPLDDRETRKVMGRRDSARQMAQRHPDHSVRQFHEGAGHAYNDVVTQFGVQTAAGTAPARTHASPKRAVRKPLKKKRKKNPRRYGPRPVSPVDQTLTRAQKTALRKLYDLGKCWERVGATLGQKSTLAALHRRGLVTELKKGWKINAAGRKAIGAPTKGKRRRNPPTKAKHNKAVGRVRKSAKRKNAKPRRPRSQRKRAAQKAARYTFTVPLEKGTKGAKCKISYPTGLFKTQAEAIRSIQKELRAKFKQLKKAPAITSCAWKYTDAAKTKGKWHFTAKKR